MSQQTNKKPFGVVPAAVISQRGPIMEELVAAQGVAGTATFEKLLNSGKDLWADDAEFEAFMSQVEAIRREKE